MPTLILHEHPSQAGDCLASLVRYAQRIPTRFRTLEETATYLRAQPYRPDDGFDDLRSLRSESSECRPSQRGRIWPSDFNCWEATAHWLAHALKLLSGNERVDIYDRDLVSGNRHVWPVLTRNGEVWLVVLDSEKYVGKLRQKAKSANLGWEDIFRVENIIGAVHTIGSGALGYFLGPLASPLVEKAEELWDSTLPDWAKSKSSKAVAKLAVQQIAKAAESKKAESKKSKEEDPEDKKTDRSLRNLRSDV